MDGLLREKYKNIVILLLDGMGLDALQYHLAADGFFCRHLLSEYSSVFPSTTTAATISIMSGLTPCEHGWLGWQLYFHELDKFVVPFRNIDYYTEEEAAVFNVAARNLPYTSIFEKINNAGVGKAYFVSRFGTTPVGTFEDLSEIVTRLCTEDGRKFIYAYWHQPDTMMHENGCYDESVRNELRQLENMVEKMSLSLPDSLLIVTADHGHKNLAYYTLTDYPDIIQMLKRPPAIESRAAAFYVRDESLEKFPLLFADTFGDDFLLFSQEDAKREKLFGDGVPHPRFDEFIGDYLAVSTSNMGIVYSDKVVKFHSSHAGMTSEEMVIPFIAIGNK